MRVVRLIMNRLLAPCLVASVVLAASLIASAQPAAAAPPWKWKDAGGQLHVSDMPPPSSIPDKDILVRPTTTLRTRPMEQAASAPIPANSTANAAAPRVDAELEARRRKAAADEQAKVKDNEEKNAAVRAENCARARSHMAALNDGLRMARTNEKGEREVLDDKGRAEEMQRARGVIASDCR
jgi:hypothetical protein